VAVVLNFANPSLMKLRVRVEGKVMSGPVPNGLFMCDGTLARSSLAALQLINIDRPSLPIESEKYWQRQELIK